MDHCPACYVKLLDSDDNLNFCQNCGVNLFVSKNNLNNQPELEIDLSAIIDNISIYETFIKNYQGIERELERQIQQIEILKDNTDKLKWDIRTAKYDKTIAKRRLDNYQMSLGSLKDRILGKYTSQIDQLKNNLEKKIDRLENLESELEKERKRYDQAKLDLNELEELCTKKNTYELKLQNELDKLSDSIDIPNRDKLMEEISQLMEKFNPVNQVFLNYSNSIECLQDALIEFHKAYEYYNRNNQSIPSLFSTSNPNSRGKLLANQALNRAMEHIEHAKSYLNSDMRSNTINGLNHSPTTFFDQLHKPDSKESLIKIVEQVKDKIKGLKNIHNNLGENYRRLHKQITSKRTELQKITLKYLRTVDI